MCARIWNGLANISDAAFAFAPFRPSQIMRASSANDHNTTNTATTTITAITTERSRTRLACVLYVRAYTHYMLGRTRTHRPKRLNAFLAPAASAQQPNGQKCVQPA